MIRWATIATFDLGGNKRYTSELKTKIFIEWLNVMIRYIVLLKK